MKTTNGKMVLFGINLANGDGKCSGRSGIIEVRDSKTEGGWRPFCLTATEGQDGEMIEGSTKICDCEHEAASIVANSIASLMEQMVELGHFVRKPALQSRRN